MKPKPTHHIALFALLFTAAPLANAQVQPSRERPEALDQLDRLVGVWHNESDIKATKFIPQPLKITGEDVLEWTLDKRFILGRSTHQPSGEKNVWLIGYDPQTQTYPLWFFNSRNISGAPWSATWKPDASTFIYKAHQLPTGWTGRFEQKFTDKNAIAAHFWMTDDTAERVFDNTSKLTRSTEEAGKKMLETWSKIETPDEPPAQELKHLDAYAGDWNVQLLIRPSRGVTEERTLTGTNTARWILDGHALYGHTKLDQYQAVWIVAWDAANERFKSWRFTSRGEVAIETGHWHHDTKMIVWKSQSNEGEIPLIATSRQVGNDVIQRHVTRVDPSGEVLIDAEIRMTRRK